MTHLSLACLILNFAVALTWGALYFFPATRPRASRFFLIFAWLWLISAALSMAACAFNPSTALQILTTTVIPMIQGIIPLAASAAAGLDPAEAALINSTQQEVMTGLNALKPVLQEYEANPSDTTLGNVQSAISSVHDNFNGLLTAAQVKNPKSQQKITGIVNTAFNTLASMESLILAKHPATVAAAAASKQAN